MAVASKGLRPRAAAQALLVASFSLLPAGCASLRPRPVSPLHHAEASRRGITRRAAGCGLFAALASSSQPSFAFDNGVAEMARFKDEKKCPKDFYSPQANKIPLGLQDSGKLATCPDSPNCFSTSGDARKNLLEVWLPQAGSDAMGELLASIKAYPPGQNGACNAPGGPSTCIDGGGFQVVSSTPSYLYVQFESLKFVTLAHEPRTRAASAAKRTRLIASVLALQGFIDDVEFAVGAAGVQVRSASRVGKIDFLVNAKRLNLISERLRAKGWTAPAITQKTHPEYFRQG